MRHDAMPGRRLSFGAPLPFVPTHDAARVAEALRGHMPDTELVELARQLRKAVNRRNRARKDSTHLSNLLALVDRASRPPALEGPIEVFDRPVGGDPLEVVLMSGDRRGDRVTQVPPGVEFVVPAHTGGQLFLRPVGEAGPDGLVLTGLRGSTIKVSEVPAGGVVLQATSPADADSPAAQVEQC